MGTAWKTIRGYIWWTYDRGSLHYDVMVTLILLFIFLTPRSFFKDKPAARNPHQTEVVINQDSSGALICQIDAAAVAGSSDAEIRESLLNIIEPIAGDVKIDRYEPVRERGRVRAYKVWLRRG